MTRCRALLAAEALAVLGIVVWALVRPVTAARGRDEIDYRHLQPLPLHSGQLLRQPIPLQRDQLSGIAIPYQLQGGRPAEIRVAVLDVDGRALSDGLYRLSPTTALTFLSVRVEGGITPGPILVVVERSDEGSAGLNLAAYPSANADRPPMAQQPDTTLAAETLYGAWRPAILKAPLYANRVSSLAPPWLPESIELILAGLFLVLGLTLATLVAIDRSEPESSPIMARELAPADATTGRDRDPRVP